MLFRILLFSVLYFSFANVSFSQKWQTNSSNTPFEGNVRYAIVVGNGGKFPYTKPKMVVNYFENLSSLNIYINDAGSTVCDNKRAYLVFDNEKEVFHFDIDTDKNNETWFFIKSTLNLKTLSNIELLEKLKKHSILFVRLESDCSKYDFSFSLNGSTSAINFVLGDYYKKLVKEEERRVEEEKQLKKFNEFSNTHLIKFKSTFSFSYYDKPTYTVSAGSIPTGIELVVKKENDNFYKIISTDYNNLKLDSTKPYYISNISIDKINFQALERFDQ